MKINISRIVGAVLVMAGFLVFLSPELVQIVQKAETQVFVTTYESRYGRDGGISDPAEKEDESDVEKDMTGVKEADALYQEMETYNRSIYESRQPGFSDPWSFQQSPMDVDGFEDGIFGYIEIPSMHQTFALYLGATMDNLSRGIAVMGETSLPIGGENTNCVIAGHRGYNANKTFFKNIEEIQIGDRLYITNPWETLTYQADSIDVVEPDDVEAVRIQAGKDMVTLLTCHPYASHGRYRYLVYCTRCEDDDKQTATAETETNLYSDSIVASDGTIYPSSRGEINQENLFRRSCIGFILLLLVLAVFKKITGRKKKHQ